MNALIFYKDGRAPEFIEDVRQIEEAEYPTRVQLIKRREMIEREHVAKIELTDFDSD